MNKNRKRRMWLIDTGFFRNNKKNILNIQLLKVWSTQQLKYNKINKFGIPRSRSDSTEPGPSAIKTS